MAGGPKPSLKLGILQATMRCLHLKEEKRIERVAFNSNR